MKKLNENIYNKLVLQAEEAKEQNLTKLANGILQSVGSYPAEQVEEFSYKELEADVYNDLWKVATNVVNYYGLESVDALKIDRVLQSLAEKVVEELKNGLEITSNYGPNEPKVLGQK